MGLELISVPPYFFETEYLESKPIDKFHEL